LSGILLALAASLSWGFADFGAGVAARRVTVSLVIVGSQAAGLVFVALVLALVRPDLPALVHVGDAALAGAFGALGLFAFYRGLAVGAMSIVGPISATGAIVPLTYGLARGERPSTLQLVGVALAVVGVIAAAVEAHGATDRSRIGAGVGLALLAAVGFGSSILFLSKASAGGDALWAPLTMRGVTVPAVVLMMLLLRMPATGLRASLWLLAGVGVCDTGANLLFALATSRGLLSVVAVLASLYPVVLVILARTLLKERIALHQLGGVAVALTGVALISAG
jgi:drug/metabolite transporter (DMT)-like permease